MWVKVDYSTEAKKNPRPNMGGQWAIYVKRHWWNKWIERDTFADADWCTREAKKIAEYPKYFFLILIGNYGTVHIKIRFSSGDRENKIIYW